MSQSLLNRNAILTRFIKEGLSISLDEPFLIIEDIPYVSSHKEIKYGKIVSKLELSGDIIQKPKTHVVYFIGDNPCDQNGIEIKVIKHSDINQKLKEGLIVNRSFSNKTDKSYLDEYYKIINYVNIITSPVHIIDPLASPYTNKPPKFVNDTSYKAFQYIDTNSYKGGYQNLSNLFENEVIGIIGLGGTGSYILDYVSKTPVKAIHLFDNDYFFAHNSFRSPGAASIDQVENKIKKVTYFSEIYSDMHRNIVCHHTFIDDKNLDKLNDLTFVFIAIDASEDKKFMINYLVDKKTPFIDLGIDVSFYENKISSTLRTTFVKENSSERWKSKISYEGKNQVYESNIQIAELNSLVAIYSIIQWKKHLKFYNNEKESSIIQYIVEAEEIINEN